MLGFLFLLLFVVLIYPSLIDLTEVFHARKDQHEALSDLFLLSLRDKPLALTVLKEHDEHSEHEAQLTEIK